MEQHSFEKRSHSKEGWHEGRAGKGSGEREGWAGGLVQFFQNLCHQMLFKFFDMNNIFIRFPISKIIILSFR